ncbi:MAG: ATP-binding protein [Verrucomicrobiota bacterium]
MNALAYFRTLPIRQKFALILLVPCLVVLLLAGSLLIWLQLASFRHNMERDLQAVAEMVGNLSTPAISLNLSPDAVENLERLRVIPQVVAATLVTPDQKLFAQYGQGAARSAMNRHVNHEQALFERFELLISHPVLLDGKQIATLHVLSDLRSFYLRVFKMVTWLLVLLTLVGIAVSITLSHRLQRFVSDPILRLTKTAHLIADNHDYSVRAREEEGTELGVLARAFNHMLHHIQRQSDAIQFVTRRLSEQVLELQHEITERERAEQQLRDVHSQLVTASRKAGMAEVATGVLHNVGNVLNSINVSVNLLNESVGKSSTRHLVRINDLLQAHEQHLGEFITHDPKGKLIPSYLARLSVAAQEQEQVWLHEMQSLMKSVEHIRDIVAMQQSYASAGGTLEDLPISDVIEDALRLQMSGFTRHGINLERHFEPVPRVRVDKHKVLQILVNLFRNARDAVADCPPEARLITVSVQPAENNLVSIQVRDTGTGIEPQNLTRVFQHGFTTKTNGHGFGLHSGALAAKQMSGSLFASSEGKGRGATFTLQLPAAPAVEEPTTEEKALPNGNVL